ncbi:response regulator transcription factor [Amycolatopsis sp. H20-H5]|uniref:response regulator transcription factor n=1 Tax=Amycolatopsis sp. H20-H5 TaxID=3046309 RepID=UPI002DBD6161|nr:response regulator transcription factor [Amycolatopsis sp. H20-H5]MEC3979089.1 response regulator transcription factor [Amycolatopsis sp. H20-H5]
MRILVVDDDADVRESLVRSLEFEGYEVQQSEDGEQALRRLDPAAETRPDLMIVDLMMPGIDGLEVCRRLRSAGERLPILMLTARDALGDRVTGLDAGADDYLPKPFALEELLARLRAMVRQARHHRVAQAKRGQSAKVVFGDLELDPVTREVTRAGRAVLLTRTEFELLALLMAAPRHVLTRAHLHRELWTRDPGTNALDVYVGYLRRKLEADGRSRLVHTVRGVGFVLRAQL